MSVVPPHLSPLSSCREEDPDDVPHGHITSLVGSRVLFGGDVLEWVRGFWGAFERFWGAL